MPARVVVFGGDSVSCISTELNTVGILVPHLTVYSHPSIFHKWGDPISGEWLSQFLWEGLTSLGLSVRGRTQAR